MASYFRQPTKNRLRKQKKKHRQNVFNVAIGFGCVDGMKIPIIACPNLHMLRSITAGKLSFNESRETGLLPAVGAESGGRGRARAALRPAAYVQEASLKAHRPSRTFWITPIDCAALFLDRQCDGWMDGWMEAH